MKKNLVVLFYPKTGEEKISMNTPLSLLKVGSELKGAGFDVSVVDERIEGDYRPRLKNMLEEALFFGVSAMTGRQIQYGLDASAFVKEINRDIPVVWGGWHPSILPEETLKNRFIDIAVVGQGEVTASELADALKNNKGLNGIDGILYKENGNILSNKRRGLRDLNSLRPLRFDVIDLEKYISENPMGERSIFWNSSQGCPYRCGFCNTPNVYNRKWTGLKAEALLGQIQTLIRDYGISVVTFAEDNFFVDINRVEKLCEGIIDRGLKIRWSTDVRIDHINRFSDRLMDLLKASGCSKLFVGAESGDEEVLRLIDKRIKLSDTYKAAVKLDRHEIISEFFMIVGFPNNPKRDFKKTLELMKKIKTIYPDHQFTPFIYTPYPGTPLFDLAVKNKLNVPGRLEDWSSWGVHAITTPWVNEKYMDSINMYSKCFYPLAFPSSSLRKNFKKRYGLLYRTLHAISKFRVKNNFFIFPLEWKLIKRFYSLKIKFNIFKDLESFR